MKYLLDSDILIDYFDGRIEIKDRVEGYIREGSAISTIAYMEALEGRLRSGSLSEVTGELDWLIRSIRVIPVSREIGIVCAEIRAVLRIQKKRVRPRALDPLIAATAIEFDLTLITRNRDDYHDIPGLVMVNP
jgi:predicted nucleic acid-binding protein